MCEWTTKVNIINFCNFFQGFQPTIDVSHLPTFTHPSPDIGQVAYHQDPALGHIGQLEDHNPTSQGYQFLFTNTNTDHKPIHYPPVPSVFDTTNDHAEDRVDNQYINGKMKHNQVNRSN